MAGEWITYDEAVEISGYKKSTLYFYAHKGMFLVRRRGVKRINRMSLEGFLRTGEARGASAQFREIRAAG